MAKEMSKLEEIPFNILNMQFEEVVILTFKEMVNTIRNLEDRIEVLEKGGK